MVQKLSRLIQSTRASDVAAEQDIETACPDCEISCRTGINRREVHSMDVPLELTHLS